MEDIVSSWNEWGRLEEVVLGNATGSAVVGSCHPSEQAKTFRLEEKLSRFVGMRPKEKVDAAAEELDGFGRILEANGVKVVRPRIEENKGFETPNFKVERMNGWTCPRDVITVVGNEIIEAPTPWRTRNFEISAYRDLLMDYYRRDPNMLWSPAPFPMLEDKLFREGYASTGAKRAQQCKDKEFVTHDWIEPTFDAADIIRCGEDVFVLHGQSCNMAGFEWIKRTLGRRGIRAHQVHHPNILNPNHIDASIMPLRPGLLLATPPVIDDCKVFKDNGWEVVTCVEPDDPYSSDPNYAGKSGKWIAMNVLSYDEKTIFVMEHDIPMIDQLEGLGFKVITVPFKNVVEFGGGLHCGTQDIRRQGDRECYFPKIAEKKE